ncbi:ATP-dependent RNA helicase [Sporocytophaga myxococcoides]|uniref:ATP-dependent RNA helicase n=1 Tax=Sporocytophaga myxococcoides TaxID=153721 RepID=A0A098LG11_9BACT|nr:DEAD/DEAH box helicase [Sporocytophaga myxococcoides]GAL85033.1 ATP-dependent RNA helicase [Sporocytophaga myxococcoides]
MSLEQLKLNKQLITAMQDAGFSKVREFQARSISRILGGQDLLGIGPEGCGKTTSLVLTTLMRLKYAQEEAPRALVLVPDKESGLALLENFQLLGKNTDLRYMGIFPGAGMEGQKEELDKGVDIVVGTPDRIQAMYYKSKINLSQLKVFIVDDAERHIKQGFQTIILQIAESLLKCQHLIFSEVYHEKLERLVEPILKHYNTVEVDIESIEQMDVIDQVLYHVPNYKTKLNLINLLMRDTEEFSKVVIFANTKITAESICKSLDKRNPGEVALFKVTRSSYPSLPSIETFIENPEIRMLIVSNEENPITDTVDIPFIFHFDIPPSKVLFIDRIKKETSENNEKLSFSFATDIELILVRKIEQEIGQNLPVEELPLGLIIEGDRKSHKEGEAEEQHETTGAAFHEKKASNAKTYNYKYMERLKLFGKKHRKHKKGE